MKKFSAAMIIALSMATTFASAQVATKAKNGKIPEKVLTEFKKEFKDVKKVNWDKEKENYEAEFVHNKQELSVTYNAEGKKLETETEIPVSQLPAAVNQYINTKKLGKVKEASKIEKADGGVEYEAEVNGTDYIFDQHGKFLKSEKA